MEPPAPPPGPPPKAQKPPSSLSQARPISNEELLNARSRAKQVTTIVTHKDGSQYILQIQEDGTEKLVPRPVDSETAKATAELYRASEPGQTKALPPRLQHVWNGQSWSKYAVPSENYSSSLQKLRVMTYNVWFEPFALPERAEELFRLISTYNPDIICFQEVTEPFLRCLKASSKCLRDGAVVSDLRGESFTTYGVITVINNDKLKPTNFTVTSFPSTMGRSLLASEMTVNGRQLVIGTSHLESLSSAPVRELQLDVAAKRFNGDIDCVYMGDFNLDSATENETLKRLLSDFTDTWETLRPAEEGKTFDTLANPMIKHYGLERARYDRVLCKSKHWKAKSIEMIGTKPFAQQEDRDLLPSDHFGLIADFEFVQ